MCDLNCKSQVTSNSRFSRLRFHCGLKRSSQISGERKTHKDKHICGIIPELGGWQKYVYVFFRVIPCGREKHTNNIPRKIPGQSREHVVYVFFFFMVFGCRKAHQLFQHKLFGPHPKHPSLGPQEKVYGPHFLERTQKGTNINFFTRILGVKKGAPNGPFSATKSLVYFLFLSLFLSLPKISRFDSAIGTSFCNDFERILAIWAPQFEVSSRR